MSVYDEETAGSIVDVILEDLTMMIETLQMPGFFMTTEKLEDMEKFIFDASHYLVHHSILDEYMFMHPIRGRTIKRDLIHLLRLLLQDLQKFGNTEALCSQIEHVIFEIDPANDPSWSSRMDMGSKRRKQKRSQKKTRRSLRR